MLNITCYLKANLIGHKAYTNPFEDLLIDLLLSNFVILLVYGATIRVVHKFTNSKFWSSCWISKD